MMAFAGLEECVLENGVDPLTDPGFLPRLTEHGKSRRRMIRQNGTKRAGTSSATRISPTAWSGGHEANGPTASAIARHQQPLSKQGGPLRRFTPTQIHPLTRQDVNGSRAQAKAIVAGIRGDNSEGL